MSTDPTTPRPLAPVDHALGVAIGQALGHTIPEIHADRALGDRLAVAAQAAADALNAYRDRQAVDAVGEALFDAAHEHCGDGGCYGGGRTWYQHVAQLLCDPFSGVTQVAVQQIRLREMLLAERILADGAGEPRPTVETQIQDLLGRFGREVTTALEAPTDRARADFLVRAAAVAAEIADCAAKAETDRLRAAAGVAR